MTLVLDAEALSVLARTHPREGAHQVIARAKAELVAGRDVLVPAAIMSELYRGGRHDQVVDACLSRFPAIVVVPTDQSLAREVGHLLARARRGSADHVDASVVAVAVQAGGGVIVTADIDDVTALSDGLAGIRVRAV